jgi:Mitochondrial carrier protein.
MNTIAPYLQPIGDLWAYFTKDHILEDLTYYPGDWHTKVIKSQRLKVNEKYTETWKRFYEEPDVYNTLVDNAYRFSLLAFAERWITVRQAQQFLKTRFTMSNNNVGALNAIRQQGLLGAFRGNLFNIAHFIGVQYHALYYANNDPLKYIFFSSVFEAALYPLETLRTLYYADVAKSFRNPWDAVVKTVERGGLQQFYRGVDFKIIYNVFFGINLWSMASDSVLQYVTLPLWLFSYAALSLKTRLQIAGSSLSFQNPELAEVQLNNIVRREGIRGLYNGFLPWAVLNLGFAWYFPSLFSEDKKRNTLASIIKEAPREERDFKYWA